MTITTPRPTKGLTETEVYANQSADLARAFNAGKKADEDFWKPIVWTLVALLVVVSAAAVVL